MPARIGVFIGLVFLILFGLFTAVRNGGEIDNSVPLYEADEAAMVTYQHLPGYLQGSLSEDDVGLILELEFAYMKKLGLLSEQSLQHDSGVIPELDMEQMAADIVAEASKMGKTFTREDVLKVLAAEDHYLRQEGIIEDSQ